MGGFLSIQKGEHSKSVPLFRKLADTYSADKSLILLGFFSNDLKEDRTQEQQARKVGESHECIASISKQPNNIESYETSDSYSYAVDNPKRNLSFITKKINDATFSIHAPAKGRREGEESQTNAYSVFTNGRQG